MNEITGIKQHFDLLIYCLIIKKLQKLGTKIDAGDNDRFDPTGQKEKRYRPEIWYTYSPRLKMEFYGKTKVDIFQHLGFE